MKILMLTPYLPLPLDSGGQIRSYNLIKHLRRDHDITLFSLIKHEKEKEYVKDLEKYCKKVKVFFRPKKPWTLQNILRTGFGPYPFLVVRNLSPAEKNALVNEVKNGDYDLIHAETFYAMPHLPETETPTILVEQTIEYLVYKHYVEKQAPFFIRPLLLIDIFKLKFWETFYWKKATRVVAVSEADKVAMRKLVPGLNIEVVSNSVDYDHFSAAKRKEKTPKRVVFVGNFSWLQNTEAVLRLVNNVWPLIKKGYGDAKLWIVGRNMSTQIKNLKNKDVLIGEDVPEIRDVYTSASVMVAPIEGPGGTRLKILESMATELPIVTTPVGAAGLDIKDGVQAAIKPTDKGLADATIKILKDKNLAKSLGQAGRRFVEDEYTWKASAVKLDKLYNKLVRK